MTRDWDGHYASGTTPWDTGVPDPDLVRLVEAGRLPHGRALEVGCGTGTNARYLAGRGYDVLGVDLSPLALERARAEAAPPGGSATYRQLDFLADELLEGDFDLVFDRGCFHVFDDPEDQARFAARVAVLLAPGGLWVSLIGSTEGPAREHGPPRRSARDVARAVEPMLALVELRAATFDADLPSPARSWILLAEPRTDPAQPSTGSEAAATGHSAG